MDPWFGYTVYAHNRITDFVCAFRFQYDLFHLLMRFQTVQRVPDPTDANVVPQPPSTQAERDIRSESGNASK